MKSITKRQDNFVDQRRVAMDSVPTASDQQKIDMVKVLAGVALENEEHGEEALRESLALLLGHEWQMYAAAARDQMRKEREGAK